MADITKLTSSWTKYDSVKVISMTVEREIDEFIRGGGIDEPVLRNYLGINSLEDDLPDFWTKIYNYPDQVGLFALVAAIFTHYSNIEWFADVFSQGNMLPN